MCCIVYCTTRPHATAAWFLRSHGCLGVISLGFGDRTIHTVRQHFFVKIFPRRLLVLWFLKGS